MRILDASVVTDAVASSGPDGVTARQLVASETRLHVPAMLGAEVTSALRKMARLGLLTPADARIAAFRAAEVRARRYPFEPFLARVWELRENVATYDAWYVALAEALDAPLVTADGRLRRAAGPRCPMLSPTEALAHP